MGSNMKAKILVDTFFLKFSNAQFPQELEHFPAILNSLVVLHIHNNKI